MKNRYYWKQLIKIFQVAENVSDFDNEKQLSERAHKIIDILKETYDDGYRCGNLKNLEINQKERSN